MKERSCEFCFDLLAIGTVHRQFQLGNGTECKPATCEACHGRGVLAAAFEGWQGCPTCGLEAKGPTLAENAEEANRMLYAGRPSVSLRESKIYDTERLGNLPLFAQRGRLF